MSQLKEDRKKETSNDNEIVKERRKMIELQMEKEKTRRKQRVKEKIVISKMERD